MFRRSYHLYAMITILCWAMAFVYTKLAIARFSPLSLGFLRFLVASFFLILVNLYLKIKPPKLKDLPWFALSGAVGFYFHMLFFNIGTGYVTSATSSVIISTIPIITALMAVIIYREWLRPYQWAAVVIEFSGIMFLTLMEGSLSANTGILWLLATALVVSLYNLIQRRLTQHYSALQVSSYSIFIGTAMLALSAPEALSEVQSAPLSQLFNLFMLGVFSSTIAYVSWTKAFSLAEKTSQVSNYMFATPLVTTALAFMIAGEIPGWSTVLGGVIIILGLVLFNKDLIFSVKYE